MNGPLDFIFFQLILRSLNERLAAFSDLLLGRVVVWVAELALAGLTLWILIEGYRIVSGSSRESMMALVLRASRALVIVIVAANVDMVDERIPQEFLAEISAEISLVVTGSRTPLGQQVDHALGWMQIAMHSIDMIDVVNDLELAAEKQQAKLMVGMGTGGPAVVVGAMMLLYRIAMTLFVGFAPLFILCLLFEQTKPLFQKWLLYGLGTMFSMAVLAVMADIAMDMVVSVATAFWARTAIEAFLLNGGGGTSLSSMAMQQGGVGLIMTTLIVTAPPIAAMFFQGVLGNFSPFSQMAGGAGSAQLLSQQSGPGPAAPSAITADASQQTSQHAAQPRVIAGPSNRDLAGEQGYGPGKRGNASATG